MLGLDDAWLRPGMVTGSWAVMRAFASDPNESDQPHTLYIDWPDRKAPVDPHTARRVADFVLDLMEKGGKVGVGCIGGHGRTGTFAALLIIRHYQRKGWSIWAEDAIEWIRKSYCKSAIESLEQENFLLLTVDPNAKLKEAPKVVTTNQATKVGGASSTNVPPAGKPVGNSGVKVTGKPPASHAIA